MDELYRKLLAQLEEGQDTVLAFITEGDSGRIKNRDSSMAYLSST